MNELNATAQGPGRCCAFPAPPWRHLVLLLRPASSDRISVGYPSLTEPTGTTVPQAAAMGALGTAIKLTSTLVSVLVLALAIGIGYLKA